MKIKSTTTLRNINKHIPFKANVAEAVSLAVDITGKGVIAPVVIMKNPFSKRPKEKRKWSAIKNPISALIQLGLEVPIFCLTGGGVKKLANKGLLDKDPTFSFNSKLYMEKFLDSLEKLKDTGPSIEKLKKTLKKKGLNKKIEQSIENIIETSKSPLKNKTKEAFEKFKTVDKRLFHFKSRLSFAAVLLAIPFICMLENWLHPKIAKYLEKRKIAKGTRWA